MDGKKAIYNGGAWHVLASEVGAMFCIDAREAEWYGITKIAEHAPKEGFKIVLTCKEFCKLIERKYAQEIKVY